MLLSMQVALAVHLLAAVIWVGGMFFSLIALRPVALSFEPGVRLLLMSRVIGRFFTWVWLSVVLLVITGYGSVFVLLQHARGLSLSSLPWAVVGMLVVGNSMFAIFLYAYFGPYRRMQGAMAQARSQEAGANLDTIRKLISLNLLLGLVIVIIGGLGRV